MDHLPLRPPRSLWTIVAIGVLQAILLAVGWVVVYDATQRSVTGNVEGFVLARNAEVARTLARTIGDLPGRFDADDPRWQSAQRAVASLRLPSGGFACVTDATGRIVCHPGIDRDPDLRRIDLGAAGFTAAAPPAGLAVPEGVETGRLAFAGRGLHFVARTPAGDAGATILVHQPAAGLALATEQLTGGLLATILGTGLAVTLVTVVGGTVLVRRQARAMDRVQADLEREVARRTRQLRRSREAVMTALAELAEHRDNETGRHVNRISLYSMRLAEALREAHAEIDDDWIDRIRVASRLHDIGKVAVPDAVLHKPGRLDASEFGQIRRHTTVAADTMLKVVRDLESDPMLAMAIEIALYHHERWDGGGYPTGVRGRDIPLSARIVAVIDVFDALRSPRVYKPSMPLAEVVGIIRESAGGHFDPDVVEAFLGCVEDMESIFAANIDVEGPADVEDEPTG